MRSTNHKTRGKDARIRAFKRITRAMKGLNRADGNLVARALFICWAR